MDDRHDKQASFFPCPAEPIAFNLPTLDRAEEFSGLSEQGKYRSVSLVRLNLSRLVFAPDMVLAIACPDVGFIYKNSTHRLEALESSIG
ncbi:MAG: hypothetical protein SWY16_01195 [Cyanobacteriota bacterium]|nr:hypothetical protein [Cyanobacteriota bacterium]